MEMAAPSSTPLTGPDPSTPSSAAIATKNSARLNRQMCRSARTSTRLMTAASTMAASTGCGRLRSSPDAKSTTISVNSGGDQARERRARARALVDERLRHAAAHGKPAAEPRDEIAGAERQELLIGVEPIAVLLAEHAADRGRLDGAEHEARQRHGQERRSGRCRLTSGSPSDGRPCGTSPSSATPCVSRSKQPRRHDAGDHHEERHRPVLEPELAGNEHRQGDGAHQQRHPVRLAQVRDEIRRALPEVPVRALEAKQLRQLRAREVERQSGLEADQHGLGEEADGVAGAHQPRAQTRSRPP